MSILKNAIQISQARPTFKNRWWVITSVLAIATVLLITFSGYAMFAKEVPDDWKTFLAFGILGSIVVMFGAVYSYGILFFNMYAQEYKRRVAAEKKVRPGLSMPSPALVASTLAMLASHQEIQCDGVESSIVKKVITAASESVTAQLVEDAYVEVIEEETSL